MYAHCSIFFFVDSTLLFHLCILTATLSYHLVPFSFPRCPQSEHLTALTLSGCALNEVHLECLVALVFACPSLETLDLSANKLGSAETAVCWEPLFTALEVRYANHCLEHSPA